MATVCGLATQIEERLLARNQIVEEFFSREALRLAEACRSMSERFLQGGRLLAFGRGPYATDAQHVSVEFVHPVIVGKRALACAGYFHPVPAVAGSDSSSRRYRDGIRPSGGRRVRFALPSSLLTRETR